MELAIHLRNVKQADGAARLQEHLSSIYDQEIRPSEGFSDSFDRIYVGDEFCLHRMPRPAELDALFDFALRHRKQCTLLTPPLTDSGIERLSPVLSRLRDRFPSAEVVGNDWGMLTFMKEEYPQFRLAAGRLLDKGFKDPRLSDAGAVSSLSEEMDRVLNSSSFDSPIVREMLIELKITRIERDIFPYRDSPPAAPAQLATSLYFPYGYVTTGRVCWMSTFANNGTSKFIPLDQCQRPCDGISMKLEHPDLALPVFEGGSTVYYLQPPAKLEAMFETAEREDIRLVYQGFAV